MRARGAATLPPSLALAAAGLHPPPLQVLHCVMFPRTQYDLPLLSFDVVAAGGRVTLAVADPCPVTPNLSLPAFYAQPVQ